MNKFKALTGLLSLLLAASIAFSVITYQNQQEQLEDKEEKIDSLNESLNESQEKAGSGEEQSPENSYITREEAANTCSQLCGDYKEASGTRGLTSAIEYCTRRFVMDSDNDGTVSEAAGTGYNSYCEDGVHCFNIHTCQIGYNELDAESCKQLMCDYYEQVQQIQASEASERIKERYQPSGEGDRSIGTCGLPELESAAGREITTWYSRHFTGTQICSYNLN